MLAISKLKRPIIVVASDVDDAYQRQRREVPDQDMPRNFPKDAGNDAAQMRPFGGSTRYMEVRTRMRPTTPQDKAVQRRSDRGTSLAQNHDLVVAE